MKIIGLKKVPVAHCRPRDDNWRLHPEHQRGALRDVIATLGFAAPIIVRELEEEDRYETLDGHLRRDVVAETQTEIDAVVLEATDAEADQLLATLDTIHKQSETDRDKLRDLVKKLSGSLDASADVRHILATESAQKRLAAKAEGLADKAKDLPMPDGMDLRAHEHYDYILVLSRSLADWQNALERFGLMEATTGKANQRHALGQGRAVWADKLLGHLLATEGDETKRLRQEVADLRTQVETLRTANAGEAAGAGAAETPAAASKKPSSRRKTA